MKENQTLQQHLKMLRQNHHSENQNQIFKNSSKEEGMGRSPLFPSHQHHLLVFAYNRHKDQSSPGQILLMEQPKKKHKEEFPMAKSQSIQQPPREEEQFFLQKVDPSQQVELTQEIKQMLSISNSMSRQDRFDRRREMFEASKARRMMEVASEEAMAKRTIRVVKLDSLIEGGSVRGVVELGRRQVPYEQLDLGETGPDYYTLIKKKPDPVTNYPRLRIEEEIMLENIYYGDDDVMEEKNLQDYDSNSENNSNNDYPDQDMSSEEGDEELIEYGHRNEWGEYDQMEDEGEDEEEVYQRYLRRVGRKEKKERYTQEMCEEQYYD